MNTVITLRYRDASNWKAIGRIVFAGEPDEALAARLRATLHDGEFFVPEQVGLESPRDNAWTVTEDDHCWCELDFDGPTLAGANGDRTITEFVEAMEAIGPDGWHDDWDPNEGPYENTHPKEEARG